jgi:NADH dehydrogenase (ubiquinone) 1 alpha subcomplex subunit 2
LVHPTQSTHTIMSLKQSFSKALKELRFHHCQTSEHSAAVR